MFIFYLSPTQAGQLSATSQRSTTTLTLKYVTCAILTANLISNMHFEQIISFDRLSAYSSDAVKPVLSGHSKIDKTNI